MKQVFSLCLFSILHDRGCQYLSCFKCLMVAVFANKVGWMLKNPVFEYLCNSLILRYLFNFYPKYLRFGLMKIPKMAWLFAVEALPFRRRAIGFSPKSHRLPAVRPGTFRRKAGASSIFRSFLDDFSQFPLQNDGKSTTSFCKLISYFSPISTALELTVVVCHSISLGRSLAGG